jgi:hypothetical protein
MARARGGAVVSGLARRIVTAMLAAASRLLPLPLRPWARAMERELDEIAGDGAALLFAAGCLWALLGLAIGQALGSGRAPDRGTLPSPEPSNRSLSTMNPIATRPRTLALLCGAGAVGIGLAYLAAAGAPSRYLIVNLAALVLGASLWLALGRAAGGRLRQSGPMLTGLAAILVLTAFFGLAVDGAARWVSVGPLNIQVSLVLLPVMLVLYARQPDAIGTAGIAAAAFALAVQPDRAMAGVLVAGLLGLLAARPGRLQLLAAGAAVAAFGWAMLKPDNLPAVPYVDQIFYTAFDVHPLAGLAVAIGAAALALPALITARGASDARPALLAFGGCWLGVIIAAALGNNPTPLVGHGGSAILGYLLSGALLPSDALHAAKRAEQSAEPTAERGGNRTTSELSVPNPA